MLRVTTMGSAQKVAQARALLARHELQPAEAILAEVLRLEPGHAGAQHMLATIAFRTGHAEQAIALLRSALEGGKNNAEMWNDLLAVYTTLGRLDEAADCCRQVAAVAPQFADGFYNYGYVNFLLGLVEEALACFRQAASLRADFAEAHASYLYSLQFHPTHSAEFILEEHRTWDAVRARVLAAGALPHGNDRSPERRLRIGYVSPNLRFHSVGRFMEPLLAHHDREKFEVFAYADVPNPDTLTQRLMKYTHTWRMISGQSDAQVAEQVRQDQIDILVDLNMHMEGSRLLMFARRPAPVQVAYLAYAGTTGLSAMDYRISDPQLDPPPPFAPGTSEPYTEKTVRLAKSYWCYQALLEMPVAAPVEGEPVVFGCLNNFAKISPQVLETWGRLLGQVAGSRLLLLAPAGRSRQRVVEALERQGIGAERVEFVVAMPAAVYFDTYRRIDVALDPFPYGGGTTTCDALWMGVPVVTLRGQRAVGRGGASILTNAGFPEWIAENEEQYVRIAAELAADRDGRRLLAPRLRQRMEHSPLMDGPGFARDMEAAYRTMWRAWCAGG